MYLSRFGVKNYKCLADVDIPLTPIHVLIGPNDAGKTSVLQAMAALHRAAGTTSSLAEAFAFSWTGQELVFQGANTDTVELFGYWEKLPSGNNEKESIGYGLSVRFPSEGRNCQLVDEWVEIDGRRDRLRSVIGPTFSALAAFRKGDVSADSPHYGALKQLCKIIRPAQLYSFNPAKMGLPAALDESRKFRMDRDGFGLPTLLHDIMMHETRRFEDLSKHFCELFRQFERIQLETEPAIDRGSSTQGLHLESRKETGIGLRLITKSGKVIRGQQLSDGTLLVLGFLSLAYLPNPPGLLLIEEPENGIYPKRLEQVIELLRAIVREKAGPQIVFTTHSPFVVSSFEPEEVTFLSRDRSRPEAGVRARPLREVPKLRERLGDQFYLGELWYNLSEEEVFGELPA